MLKMLTSLAFAKISIFSYIKQLYLIKKSNLILICCVLVVYLNVYFFVNVKFL